MNIFTFQSKAADEIAAKFDKYSKDPLLITKTKQVPFYQSLSSITGSGKTLILVETIVLMRALLPIEPIVLWLSKGKVVVEQTLQNLMVGKYAKFLGNFTVKPLLDTDKEEIEDSSKGLILVATVGKFNQKDREQGDRKVFRAELDYAESSLWDMLKKRHDSKGRKRPFLIVYDEGHNLSDQQMVLLLDLNPDAIIAASATAKVPEALDNVINRLRTDKEWRDEDFSTVIHSSEVVAAGLIKERIQLGGYVTPMEVALNDMLADMKAVENSAEDLGLDFKPKAIYVSTTNVVEMAILEDSTKTPFEQRNARPIVIWRHLVEEGEIDPKEIAVYCNLKFGKENPPPPEFNLFAGGDNDYQNFIAGNYKHIIFNLSLQEGWDDPECYFAYIDKDMGSKLQITQIIGRVLRQPNAEHYGDPRLNTAHFYIRTDEKNVFEEVIKDVKQQLATDTPEITLTVYKSTGSKKEKPTASIKKAATVPRVAINTEPAFEAVKRVLDDIQDYRKDDINTVGQGERLTVLQKIGTSEDATEEWTEVEHSNPVTARWVLSKEVQKHYAKALTICEIEGGKFDAKVEYNSLAADYIRRAAGEIVDAFLKNSEVVQDWTEPLNVPEVVVNPNTFIEYKNAVHNGYSDLNPTLEKPFADALDKTGNTWFRNPSRGFFEIPLLDGGKTKNFNPDFLVWVGKSRLVAIDTKGSHLLTDDAARKLFFIKSSKGAEVLIRFVSDGYYTDIKERKSNNGYTVWLVKNGKVTPIPVNSMEEAAKVCIRD